MYGPDVPLHLALSLFSHIGIAAIGRLAPAGVDVFFDNVGGPQLDDALENMARGGRIVICGAVSQ